MCNISLKPVNFIVNLFTMCIHPPTHPQSLVQWRRHLQDYRYPRHAQTSCSENKALQLSGPAVVVKMAGERVWAATNGGSSDHKGMSSSGTKQLILYNCGRSSWSKHLNVYIYQPATCSLVTPSSIINNTGHYIQITFAGGCGDMSSHCYILH